MRLTYHTKNNSNLFTYDELNSGEMTGRLVTHYFVKEGKIYENKGGNIVNDEFSLLLEHAEHEEPYGDAIKYPDHIVGLEYRDFNDNRKILREFEFNNHQELLPYLLVFKPIINDRQYTRCSIEWDEDRNVYVLYLV